MAFFSSSHRRSADVVAQAPSRLLVLRRSFLRRAWSHRAEPAGVITLNLACLLANRASAAPTC